MNTMQPTVIKIGGHEMDDHAFLTELAMVIAALQEPVIIVHGGGKEISMLQQKMGIEPRYLDGVRITDEPSLALVEMVLCGTANKRLVRTLIAAGIDTIGLSGQDRGLIKAEKMQHPTQDMGFTGVITSVRGSVLQELIAQGITPVVSPISLGPTSALNVNADHAAGAVAGAVNANRVVFITNVEGVLANGSHVPTLTATETRALIADGTIFGGMIPKVETALHALDNGVSQAVITNLAGLKTHGGTVFTSEDTGV